MTKISVVMSTRNGAAHIDEAIDSILNQTFLDFELIVCNDHSTDGTSAIINRYCRADSRVKIFENCFSPGLTSALNYGIEQATGEYIARMDDDDIAHPDRLEIEAVYLDNHPNISIVSSNVNFFDSNGVYGRTNKIKVPSKTDIWRGKIFTHPAVMFRKKNAELVGLYSEDNDVIRIEDYDFWCKFYYKGFYGINLDKVLLDYREDDASFKKRDMARKIRLAKCMLRWWKDMELPVYYLIFVLYELFKLIIPQKLIQKYHRRHFASE